MKYISKVSIVPMSAIDWGFVLPGGKIDFHDNDRFLDENETILPTVGLSSFTNTRKAVNGMVLHEGVLKMRFACPPDLDLLKDRMYVLYDQSGGYSVWLFEYGSLSKIELTETSPDDLKNPSQTIVTVSAKSF